MPIGFNNPTTPIIRNAVTRNNRDVDHSVGVWFDNRCEHQSLLKSRDYNAKAIAANAPRAARCSGQSTATAAPTAAGKRTAAARAARSVTTAAALTTD